MDETCFVCSSEGELSIKQIFESLSMEKVHWAVSYVLNFVGSTSFRVNGRFYDFLLKNKIYVFRKYFL